MNRLLALLVLIAALAFAASPMIFDNFAGYPPDLFPVPQQDPPIQPAGWAFAIWGLIYAWLIAGAGYGLWRAADDDDWRRGRLPLLISLGIGFFWLPTALRAPVLATLMILAMLGFAVAAFVLAGRRDAVWQVRPVALYAGWLTAASGASLGIVLGGFGLLGETPAAILCLTGVTALALAVQAARPAEIAYPAGVIWALIGIMVANAGAGNWLVLAVAAVGAGLLVLQTLRARSHA